MAHKIKGIEEDRGLPLRDVLIDSFREHGTQKGVATALNVNQSTISYWLMKCGLSIQSVLVDEKTGERVS